MSEWNKDDRIAVTAVRGRERMPRQARLDAPGTLHHVILRGIERRAIVADEEDRRQFVER